MRVCEKCGATIDEFWDRDTCGCDDVAAVQIIDRGKRSRPESSCQDFIKDITTRFGGLDIQFRRIRGSWPGQWRVSIITAKNERHDYRLVAFGNSMTEAIESVRETVNTIDAMKHSDP